jgi:hypothetical protein
MNGHLPNSPFIEPKDAAWSLKGETFQTVPFTDKHHRKPSYAIGAVQNESLISICLDS